MSYCGIIRIKPEKSDASQGRLRHAFLYQNGYSGVKHGVSVFWPWVEAKSTIHETTQSKHTRKADRAFRVISWIASYLTLWGA
ncbi:MAG TPA: hypothetical protein VF131_07780, partial [Blastocatellia bacterium]|nr:hypothetical protein [Blastocatellia bacterium]